MWMSQCAPCPNVPPSPLLQFGQSSLKLLDVNYAFCTAMNWAVTKTIQHWPEYTPLKLVTKLLDSHLQIVHLLHWLKLPMWIKKFGLDGWFWDWQNRLHTQAKSSVDNFADGWSRPCSTWLKGLPQHWRLDIDVYCSPPVRIKPDYIFFQLLSCCLLVRAKASLAHLCP